MNDKLIAAIDLGTTKVVCLVGEMTETGIRIIVQGDEEVLHVIPQSYNIDNFTGVTEPVGMPGTQISANFKIFVGKKNSSVYTADVVKRAGLNLRQIILEPMASAKAVLSEEEMELGVAMVDIGGGTTDLLIIQNNIVRHAAVIPFGGKSITSDIKIGCSIAEKNAEQLKIEHGCCYSPLAADKKTIFVNGINGREGREISAKLLSSIIEARVSELFEAVYYEIERSGYKDKLKAGLVLTGGTSKLAHIKELAQVITGLDTSLGAPSQVEDSVVEMNDPALSTAVGLVMMGAEDSRKRGYSKVNEYNIENTNTYSEVDINDAVEEEQPELVGVTSTPKERRKERKNGPSMFTKLKNSFSDIFKEDDNEA